MTTMNQNDSTTMKGVALLAATLSSFLTPFMVNAINVALPIIGKKFSADTVLLSWVATGYLLAAAMFLLVVAAVEAALALALVVVLFRRKGTLDAEAWRGMRG